MSNLIPREVIERKIYLIRGHKVMLDKDLASLYEVDPRALRQQVKRNKKRFPEDFIFQLTKEELDLMVSQNVTPSRKHFGGYLPYAFTEQGVAMLSGVLHSKRAVQVNIAIMRAFVKLHDILMTHKELAHKLDELEQKIEKHDIDISSIFEAIRQLMAPPP
ncbi:MAG: ORF6N domain-containing protein [Candidatus Omnitrophota bacterium]|nr:ORF6N domain-containing protein [Candidatus Omnitrophota bacterium]